MGFSADELRRLTLPVRFAPLNQWFTVLIPTRQSARWIRPLLQHYLAHGVAPVILLDARTDDNTAEIIVSLGLTYFAVQHFTCTEAAVSMAQDIVSTPWALFVHDDEMPSATLFERLSGPPPPDEVQSVAISRRWAWHEPGSTLTFGRSEKWADRALHPGADHHWRLFRPQQVRYVPAMHSDGFYIDRWCRFSPDKYIVHFEWVLRSHAQRTAKLRRYDEVRYGYGKFFQSLYLPEDQPAGDIEYSPFETHEFDELAALYYSLRNQSPVIQRPSLQAILARMKFKLKNFMDIRDEMAEPADRRGLNVQLELEQADNAAGQH